jgi:hypothetical protein
LRAIAVLLGLSLMIGEGIRSWGQDRPPHAWLDDQLMGGLLIVSAWLLRRPTPERRALFTGAWGVSAGMLYGSFFNKLFDPGGDYSSSIPGGTLTLLIGLAFITAISGFAASILIRSESAK